MLALIWPIALVVGSNVIYHLAAKSVPDGIDPLASLTVTYLIGAVVSGVLYYLLGGKNLLREYAGLNWAPFALGACIVGLEAGFIYAYKNGWQIGTAQLIASGALSVVLLILGALVYGEQITLTKAAGAVICLAGLYLLAK